MGKPTLATADVRYVAEIYTNLGLSAEYITTLAAYLQRKLGKFTGHRLRIEAERLASQDVSTLEELEIYVKEREEETAAEWEIRRVLGIYNRNLSQSERKYFKKWTEELCFGTEIISLAFDKTVSGTGGKLQLGYMDKILVAWHDGGCKTAEECEAHSERTRPEEKKSEGGRRRPKTEDPKPKYGNFDPEEAFKAALARSFADDE